ncbi:MAG TPA: hypothetical protein VG370_14490 [Chloroflexota bacterium]|jgi:hypothetical protein|nr:hypothetical protein [Chloroflexota bacterium]
MRRLTCLGALALLFLTTGLAVAKGPASRVTIGGADLAEQIVVTDPAALEILAFLDAGAEAAWPRARAPTLTAGYELVRSWGDPLAAVDRLRSFPDPAGGRGYVWRTADGKWFRVSADSEAALRRILAAPRAPPEPPDRPAPGLGAAAAAGAAAVSVWLLGRRRLARVRDPDASKGDV